MKKIHLYDKILSPMVTEKSTNLSEQNKVVFKVPRKANKVNLKKNIDIKIKLINAGHIPGSASIIIEGEGKRIAYTGDINAQDSSLVQGADMNYGELDLLITESTYGLNDHPERKDVENEFVSFAEEVTDKGGTLLVPAFAVGRSQEIACTLNNHNFSKPVVMDGMALKVNEIMFKHPEYLRDPKIFSEAIKSSTAIREHAERKRAMGEPCVVISPAGMLVGGNAVYYLQQLSFDSKNGIALVSYQGEGTPGKKLLDTGKVSTRGKDLNVQAEVKQFQFSGHADKKELFAMMKTIKGNPKVWTVHGDSESCQIFAQEIHEQFGFETYAPMVNDKITI